MKALPPYLMKELGIYSQTPNGKGVSKLLKRDRKVEWKAFKPKRVSSVKCQSLDFQPFRLRNNNYT